MRKFGSKEIKPPWSTRGPRLDMTQTWPRRGLTKLKKLTSELGAPHLDHVQTWAKHGFTKVQTSKASSPWNAEFGAEVAGESERNEKITTKPRRPLPEPMRMDYMEPCVRI
ncbi:hypothetical protein PIB30_021905 [Stylosanthes scabra]|uniref:Uncharacterized protein n=1 Tax=Stylosanthes scabra TaxID=79078 RepID=A0ABU6S9C4_9FABA|nr:hypothetical protein [Stylosanthes scabra]